MYLDDDIN